MTCKAGLFGHNPAMAGEGCAGCDAEHRRMMDKHIGPVLPGAPDAQDFQARIAREMAFDAGAAVAFGLMGMAEAVRVMDARRWMREFSDVPPCPGCGRRIMGPRAPSCCYDNQASFREMQRRMINIVARNSTRDRSVEQETKR